MDDQYPDGDTPFPAASSRRQVLRSLVGVFGMGAVLVLAGCGGGGGEDDEEGGGEEGGEEGEDEDDD